MDTTHSPSLTGKTCTIQHNSTNRNNQNEISSSTTIDMLKDCCSNKLVKTSDKHAKFLLENLNLLRKQKELCDVILIVGQNKIPAHRAILSACSPYFRAMFTGELAESRQTEIIIRDIEEYAMELLIEYCYTSRIVVDEKNVQMLLPAACILQIEEVQITCCEFLQKQLDPTNCLGIRAFADTHSCRELLRVADRYAQQHFIDVKESEEFLFLPIHQLIDIISSDELNMTSEEDVFNAVMQWISCDVQQRKQYLPKILEHVRFPLMSARFLVNTVSSDSLIRSDQACRDLVDEAKDYLLLPQERLSMQGPRTRRRKPIKSSEVLFAVGGWCSGDAIASVEMFDPVTNEWRAVSPMSKRRCGVGVAVLNNLLYAVGGHDGVSYLNSVEKFDPQTNQWNHDIAPTSSCRTSVGVAVLDGCLFAVGGQDGISCLNLVEKYDPSNQRWTRITSMSSKRLGVAVAVLDGYLYAIGGSDGQSPLNTVERYESKTNKWLTVASMATRRKHLGCAVYNGFIYAVGGRDDATELSTAERYNPKTNQWSSVVAMNSRRSGVGLAVVNNNLMAIGGFDGTAYLKSVELYDSESNSWKLQGGMNYRRLGGGVGVIKIQQYDSILYGNNSTSGSSASPDDKKRNSCFVISSLEKKMINSQTTSNGDQGSLCETINDSTNHKIDNQKEEFSPNGNDNDDSNETMKTIRDGKVPKPDDERKLFVGQLSSDITKEDLQKYFSTFGSIEDVTIKYDVPGGRARGFAFILFDDKESIQKVLNVQTHTINQSQIDPKPAHRRPPVTNPVKKIFIGQLPTDFVEQDLSDYFSQFGIIDTIELPMDREKSVRRPFGFVSFSSEKTAEEVLRQQRHLVNGASIEVRPAKPRPHEQQQLQMQQQYQYGEYILPHHHHNQLISSISAPTMTHPSMINVHANQSPYYTHTSTNNNYAGQIDQWSQGANNGVPYWSTANSDIRNNNNNNNNNNNSITQWSTGRNGGLSSVNGNNSVYGTLGNSVSSSSSVYQQNQGQSMYNPNGLNQQGQYPHSNYSNHLHSSYGISSSQSTGNVYGSAYPSSPSIIPPNDIQTSSSSWNQYAPANLGNGSNQTNYDPNMYYGPYYANLFAQQYYPQQQAVSQSQVQIPMEQTISPNGFPTPSNGGLDKSYQQLAR
ncbi:unnamed protein product [Rotaria magnacalcarata]|nr:unnamed protein product [Rotaria magnacalcarata]